MRKRNLALAVATVWACLLMVPGPSLGEKIPIKPLEPLEDSPGGGGSPDSDPWVPDGSTPTGSTLHAPNVRSSDINDAPRRAPALTQDTRVVEARVYWYLRILQILRALPGGGVR